MFGAFPVVHVGKQSAKSRTACCRTLGGSSATPTCASDAPHRAKNEAGHDVQCTVSIGAWISVIICIGLNSICVTLHLQYPNMSKLNVKPIYQYRCALGGHKVTYALHTCTHRIGHFLLILLSYKNKQKKQEHAPRE